MTRSTIPLQDLAQRISQQQADLVKLRQEYEARQAQLQELTRRKEELQTQLQQVEGQIQGVGQGSALPPKPAAAPAMPTKPLTTKPGSKSAKPVAAPTMPAKPATTKPGTKPSGSVTLAQLLVQIVVTAAGPITIKELAAEVVRRKHPTTSRNIPALVADQVKKLVKKGFLRRAPNQQGVLPPQTQAKPKAPAATSTNGVLATKPKTPTVAATAKTRPSAGSTSALTLPAVVTKILAASPEPIPGRELAEKVLASGYQTKSKDFLNVLWVGVGKMDNVENVPGKGYHLKKGKTAPVASTGAGKGSK